MRVSIVVDDGFVGVGTNEADKLGYLGLDMTGIDPTIWALQWYGTYGEVEWREPDAPNTRITDFSPYQFLVDRWQVAHDEATAPAPPPEPRPITSVTMRQARLALLQAGLLDQVDAAITDPASRIEWEYATTVERNSALVQSLSAGLGLSEQQLDDLFTLAATL